MPYQYAYANPVLLTDASGLCVVQNGRIIDIQRLDCTIQDFERFTVPERRNWVTTFSRTYGVEGWFNNVNDIISFFEEACTLRNLKRGSWASWSDAGVLQVIQDGQSLFQNGSAVNPVVPASRKWESFFRQNQIAPRDIRTLKSLWAPAEQAGVDYGIAEANKRVQPTGMEAVFVRNFVESGNIYRRITGVIGGGGAAGCTVARKLAAVLVKGQFPPLLLPPLIGLQDPIDDVACRIGAAGGEWFTNPWSRVPLTDHGPTYFSAKFIEQATLWGLRPQDIFEEVLR